MREHRPGFHGGVVGDDEAVAAVDLADDSHDAGGGHVAPLRIHAVRGPESEFECGGLGVE